MRVWICIILIVLLGATLLVAVAIANRTHIWSLGPGTNAPTLFVIVPDSFSGTVSLWPPGDASDALAKPDGLVVRIDSQGRGTLSDCSIVNTGFVLDMRRVSGQRIPFVVFQSDVPSEGEYCMMAQNGPTGSCVAWTVVSRTASDSDAAK